MVFVYIFLLIYSENLSLRILFDKKVSHHEKKATYLEYTTHLHVVECNQFMDGAI